VNGYENEFTQVKNDKGNDQNWKWAHEESGVVTTAGFG